MTSRVIRISPGIVRIRVRAIVINLVNRRIASRPPSRIANRRRMFRLAAAPAAGDPSSSDSANSPQDETDGKGGNQPSDKKSEESAPPETTSVSEAPTPSGAWNGVDRCTDRVRGNGRGPESGKCIAWRKHGFRERR